MLYPLCVDDNVIERVYSFTLFGIVIQCNLKWTVDQTILAVVYNQSRTTNKSRLFIVKFAATVTKGVKRFSIRRIVFPYRVNENNRGQMTDARFRSNNSIMSDAKHVQM